MVACILYSLSGASFLDKLAKFDTSLLLCDILGDGCMRVAQLSTTIFGDVIAWCIGHFVRQDSMMCLFVPQIFIVA